MWRKCRLKTYYYDYKNENFDRMRSIFNMLIYVWIRTFVMCMCIFLYIYVNVCVYVCIYACMYMHMYVYMYMYMYVCVYMYIYVCVCMYRYIYTQKVFIKFAVHFVYLYIDVWQNLNYVSVYVAFNFKAASVCIHNSVRLVKKHVTNDRFVTNVRF